MLNKCKLFTLSVHIPPPPQLGVVGDALDLNSELLLSVGSKTLSLVTNLLKQLCRYIILDWFGKMEKL